MRYHPLRVRFDQFLAAVLGSRRFLTMLIVATGWGAWTLRQRYRGAWRVRLHEDRVRAARAIAGGVRSPDLVIAGVLAVAALIGGTAAVAALQSSPDPVFFTPSAGPIRLTSAWRFGQLLLLTTVSAYALCRFALRQYLASNIYHGGDATRAAAVQARLDADA